MVLLRQCIYPIPAGGEGVILAGTVVEEVDIKIFYQFLAIIGIPFPAVGSIQFGYGTSVGVVVVFLQDNGVGAKYKGTVGFGCAKVKRSLWQEVTVFWVWGRGETTLLYHAVGLLGGAMGGSHQHWQLCICESHRFLFYDTNMLDE